MMMLCPSPPAGWPTDLSRLKITYTVIVTWQPEIVAGTAGSSHLPWRANAKLKDLRIIYLETPDICSSLQGVFHNSESFRQ